MPGWPIVPLYMSPNVGGGGEGGCGVSANEYRCAQALGNVIRVVHPGSGSWIWSLIFYPSRFPDPGFKKAPDPGSGSATLDLTPYLVYGTYLALRCPRPWRSLSSAASDRAPQQAGAAFFSSPTPSLADVIMKLLRGINHMRLLDHWDCCFASYHKTIIMLATHMLILHCWLRYHST